MLASRRSSSEAAKHPSIGKGRRATKKDIPSDLFKDGLNWDRYLQICNLPAAPARYFTQTLGTSIVNKFEIGQKLEAQDPRNPTSICLATVISLQGPRILLRLDGSDRCNDFWRLVDSGDIYMLGTHEAKGVMLTPPLGYTRNVSTWNTFLAKNRVKGDKVPQSSFFPEPASPDENLFEVGMKLEAVDKKNPDLICPATIGDVKGDQIFISFDGWRGAMDYWCHYTSRDVFAIGWCSQNDHPITSPGTKGDNPAVLARLQKILEESKRQTRSGSSLADAEKSNVKMNRSEVLTPTGKSYPQPSTGSRGNSRTTRSLTPVPRRSNRLDKILPVPKRMKPHGGPQEALPSSHETSSGEDESCDTSSSSSSQSSDSASSAEENETTAGSSKRSSQDSSDDENCSPSQFKLSDVVEITKQSANGSQRQISEEERKKCERKLRKKIKKEKRKLRRMSKHGEDDIRHYRRKRYKSTGDEESLQVKRKKKRHVRSVSGIYDSSVKNRMLGFGKPTVAVTSPTGDKSIHSPSFLNNSTTPTSLFGESKEEIVKKATTGWPLRFLVGGSEKVVTSDNKLGKFGSVGGINGSCQAAVKREGDVMPQVEEIIQGQVTTTTREEEAECSPSLGRKEVNCMSRVEILKSISSQTVSSTTHPASTLEDERTRPSASQLENPSSLPAAQPTPKPRSRNPQRWSVDHVVSYIQENEPALHRYARLFKAHEIDGQALLLLNSDIAVKYMSMKLGPALKLANLVEKIKRLVPPPRDYI